MKSVFKLLTVVLISLLLASCGGGGSTTTGLVGEWHADLSSFDLVLGDGVPAPMKGMVEAQKTGLLEQGKAQQEDFTIEFTDAGKMVVSKKGDEKTEELDYTFDGNKLALSGEIEGDKVNISLNVSEVSADKFTIAMTGEEILAQIKTQAPELLAGAGEMDVDAMVTGCSVAISFTK
ncbi:MAG: hypothetical protein JKY03_00870 [Aureispira sp.]|nr:hypothetical protein [Aureispira sp.]